MLLPTPSHSYQKSDSSDKLSFSFRVYHRLSLLFLFSASIYLYLCLSHQIFYPLAFPPPSTLLGLSRVTLWRRSIHLTHIFLCVRGKYNAHTRSPHHAFIQTRVGDKERKEGIQEHTSGLCPYSFFSPTIYLYHADSIQIKNPVQSCISPAIVLRFRGIPPFPVLAYSFSIRVSRHA